MKHFLTVLFSLVLLTAFTYAQESDVEMAKKMKPALVVIDVQNAFLPMMDQNGKDSAIARINYYIDLFRQKGFPIIRVYHTDLQQGPKPDTEPFEFTSAIKIQKEDPKVIKNYGDAFNKTDLDKILKEKGRNMVLLCGLSATGCVLATYIGAQNHDLYALFIKGALISPKLEHTKNIEEIFQAVDTDVVKFLLEHAQK